MCTLHLNHDNSRFFVERRAILEEIYHGAAARSYIGAYADFLAQVVRFQENALRVLCLDRRLSLSTGKVRR